MASARSFSQFREAFSDEASCAAFMFKRRWPDGFVCPACGKRRVAALKRGHLANDARIMPVACQTRIGFVAVGEQRGSTLHVGVYEGFDRGGGIVGDHGEANAAGTRVEIFFR